MKRTILAAILAAAFVGNVQAGTTATATSGAAVGSATVTANVQNGFSIQGTKTGAYNASQASATKIPLGPFGSIVNTSAATGGGTSGSSYGVSYGAFGATGGFATQGGTAFGAAW